MMDEAYKKAVNLVIKNIQKAGRYITAFNTNIDAIVKVNSTSLRINKKTEEYIKKSLSSGFKREIWKIEDLYLALFLSIKRGKADEWLISRKEVYDDIAKRFSPIELRMGGQAGIMANVLGALGVETIVHCAILSEEQCSLFEKNVYAVRKMNGEYKVVPVKDAAKKGIYSTYNWIFEFAKGTEFKTETLQAIAPRDNRFIATWDPKNSKMEIDKDFKDGICGLLKNVEWFVVSGYQLLRERYNGETYADRIRESVSLLKEIRKKGVKIHLELASTHSLKIRREIVKKVFPVIDSLGFNEVEMTSFMEAMSKKVIDEHDSVSLYTGISEIMKKYGNIRRVHAHDLGYYLAITKNYLPTEILRDSLLFSSTLAATKAIHGRVTRKNIKDGLDTPISERGKEMIKKLSNHLNDENFESSWCMELNGKSLSAIATKVVKNPVSTVGLGDTISISALVAESVLKKIKEV